MEVGTTASAAADAAAAAAAAAAAVAAETVVAGYGDSGRPRVMEQVPER